MSYHVRHQFDDDERLSIYASPRRYSDSDQSDDSYQSRSTAPTEYDYCYKSPSHHDYHIKEVMPEEKLDDAQHYDYQYQPPPEQSVTARDARCSVQTYASTVPTLHERDDDQAEFELPLYQPQLFYSDDLPATPADFAQLFPSTRRLMIAHDDSASDGNMNLKINTQLKHRGRIQNLTLFHLRMYDLRSREFSLRRYDRGSGREVCHTVRKHGKTASERRPVLQRSWSSAIATLRSMSDHKMAVPRRSDSGYESHLNLDHSGFKSADNIQSRPQTPKDTIKLEFSNYAQVKVKCRGTGSSKRYDFEYWGNIYHWKRAVRKGGQGKEVAYHLFQTGYDQPLAHIVPDPLGSFEKHEEELKGGWVPPCSMWISDERVCRMQNDVSDVVVAAGLIALVDDCIGSRFRGKDIHRMAAPMRSSA